MEGRKIYSHAPLMGHSSEADDGSAVILQTRCGISIGIYYGNSIAFAIRSFNPSVSSQLIVGYSLT